MKVLQICYAYPPSFSGYGRQLHTVNLALGTKAEDIRIEILTAFDGLSHRKDHAGIRGFFGKPRASYRYDGLRFYLFCARLLLEAARFRLPDVVHVVRAGPEAMISVLFAKMFGRPIVVKVARNEFGSDGGASILAWLRRRISAKADMLIALSDAIRSDLIAVGVPHERIITIPNAVDSARFKVISDQEREALFREQMGRERREGEKVFLFVGAISRRKGVHDLLAALEQTESPASMAVLLFGPDYREIEGFSDWIARINREKNNIEVVYGGESRVPERLMQMSDCLILPSYSEGMPNVMLEGLACGLEVIASDIDVNREVLQSHLGKTFRTGDPQQLAVCIATTNDGTIRSAQARTAVAETMLATYGIDAVADRYLALYRRLAGRPATDRGASAVT